MVRKSELVQLKPGVGSSKKSFDSIMDGLNTAWSQNVKQYNPDKK